MDKIKYYVYLKYGRLFEERDCNISTCEVLSIVYNKGRDRCEKCDLKLACRFRRLLR